MSSIDRATQSLRQPGLFSFPLTPFDSADHVDPEVFRKHVEDQIDAGPAALFVACGTGEFTALGLDEYELVVSTAVNQADGRLPVFAGVGGGPRAARDVARIAELSGANGLLLLPPYLVEAPAAGLVRHVEYVAASTQLPVVVYQRANAVFTPAAAVALLDIPNVVGLKDGRGDIDGMQRIVTAVRSSGHPRAADFAFLNGIATAEITAPAYRGIGIDNYSSAVLCFAPDIARAFQRAVVGGNETVVQALLAEFYLPFADLRDTVPGYAVSLVKAGARLRGLEVGPVRPPLVEARPEHIAQLEQIIERGRAALRDVEALA